MTYNVEYKTIKAGIIGGAGYTGGEAIRLLLNHPNVALAFVNSNSNAGNYLYQVHTDLLGDTDLKFTDKIDTSVDVLFLCLGHGDSVKWLNANPIPDSIRIIDLSQDFRLAASSEFQVKSSEDVESRTYNFIYGLPELNKETIKNAKYIANPGCFATAIQLGLLPLAKAGLLTNDVFVNATTGSTGAGQKSTASTHFSWRTNNLSVYKAFTHQHLGEITQSLHSLQGSYDKVQMSFIPERGAFARGILANIVIKTDKSEAELVELYNEYYKNAAFTHVSPAEIDLKQVVNTNKCLLHLQKDGDRLLVTSIIDNLVKGASGQAVQNMNLMFGLDKAAGLKLKATAF